MALYKKAIFRNDDTFQPKRMILSKEKVYSSLQNLYYGFTTRIQFEFYDCCPVCNGTGEVVDMSAGYGYSEEYRPCLRCEGSGECVRNAAIGIDVPPTAKNDDILYYEFEDCYIRVKIECKKNNKYTCNMNDLFLIEPIPIHLCKALCGGNFFIHHFRETLSIEISWKVIRTNTLYVIRQKGLASRHQNDRGDLYVRFKILMPDLSLLDHETIDNICKELPAAHNSQLGNNIKYTPEKSVKLSKIDDWDRLGMNEENKNTNDASINDTNSTSEHEETAPECKQM